MKLILRNTFTGVIRLFEKPQGIVWIIKLKELWQLYIYTLFILFSALKLRGEVHQILPHFFHNIHTLFCPNYPHFSPSWTTAVSAAPLNKLTFHAPSSRVEQNRTRQNSEGETEGWEILYLCYINDTYTNSKCLDTLARFLFIQVSTIYDRNSKKTFKDVLQYLVILTNILK